MPAAPAASRALCIGRKHTSIPTLHKASQRTQVVGDVAEFPDHLGITENSGGRITGATECDGADMTLLVRKRLGTHHGSVCIEAFDRLPRRDALVSSNKRQSDEVGFFRHLALLS